MSCLTYPAKKIKALVSQRLLDLGDTLLKRTLLNIWKTVYKCLVFFLSNLVGSAAYWLQFCCL